MKPMMKQAEWSHTWEELVEPPIVTDAGLYVPLRGAKKVLGLFASGVTGKTVTISSQDKCQVGYHLWCHWTQRLAWLPTPFDTIVCKLAGRRLGYLQLNDVTMDWIKDYEANYFWLKDNMETISMLDY